MNRIIITLALTVLNWAVPRDFDFIDDGTSSHLPHRVLPTIQGYAVLVDSSGNGYSAWTQRQECLAYNPSIGGLQFINRHYSPTSHLNVHQTDNDMSFWLHDMQIYQCEHGPARYPTSVASANEGPHITSPVLSPVGGTWGGNVGQYEEGGWYSSFWSSPVHDWLPVRASIGKQLPDGHILIIDDIINSDVGYRTYTCDLSTLLGSGWWPNNSYWGFDIYGGIGYVFYHDSLNVYYRTTTDAITWSPEMQWNISLPQPYQSSVLGWKQMALTDEGGPILVFDIQDGADYTFPHNSKVYVQTATGATPVQISDDGYATSWYPTVCTGGDYVVVLYHVWTNDLEDSLARHDLFVRCSTDDGATWAPPVNITENTANRPGLAQLAKRLNAADNSFFYFYGVNQVIDHDPYWHIVYDPQGLDPHAWYVGRHEIPTGITEDERELERLTQNIQLEVYPNPFKTTTTVRYTIHDSGCKIKNPGLRIYDITGRVVKFLNLESCILNHESRVRWCGDDDSGRPVPAGVYFLELNTGSESFVEKIVKLE